MGLQDGGYCSQCGKPSKKEFCDVCKPEVDKLSMWPRPKYCNFCGTVLHDGICELCRLRRADGLRKTS